MKTRITAEGFSIAGIARQVMASLDLRARLNNGTVKKYIAQKYYFEALRSQS